MIARREAGPYERRLNSKATVSEDVQMRVGKQLWPRILTKNRQSDSLSKSQLTLSHGVLMKGELVSMKK